MTNAQENWPSAPKPERITAYVYRDHEIEYVVVSPIEDRE